MSFRPISVLAAILALSLGSSPALAAPLSNLDPPPNNSLDQSLAQTPRRSRGQQFKERFIEQLNLTEDQKQKMEEIRQQYQGQISQYRETLRAAQKELGDMMAGTNSADAIRAKHQEVINLRQELGELRFESILEMREVLTPEQRSQFAQLMKQNWENRRNRFGNRSGNRDRF